jgi:Icc-related predicted phosphoesterase
MLGRLRRPTRTLRIVFATDLHGADLVFRKFLNAAVIYEADVAILGGDLTGKRIVPLVVNGDGKLVSAQDPDVISLGGGGETEAVMTAVRDRGRYPVAVTAGEYEELAADHEAVERRFVRECHEQLERWLARARAQLEPRGIPFYVTGGNDDYQSIEPLLSADPFAINGEGQVVTLAPGIEMISTGYGNPTPWNCPRDVSEDELHQIIVKMADRVAEPASAVFNIHVPPHGSGLDTCPRLDTTVTPPRPVAGEKMSAGSTAVRSAIEAYAPLLSLHGHIHESAGITRIGPTTCVNPGSEYEQGVLRTAVLDVMDEGGSVVAQLLEAS